MLQMFKLNACRAAVGISVVSFGTLIATGSALAADAAAPAKANNAIESGFAPLPPTSNAAVERAAKEMADAALNFWKALTPEQQAKCSFPFESAERFNWHFIPRE